MSFNNLLFYLNHINLRLPFTMQIAEWSPHVCFHSWPMCVLRSLRRTARVTQAGSSLKMGRGVQAHCALESTYRGDSMVHSPLASIRPPWHQPPVSGEHGPSQQWRSVNKHHQYLSPLFWFWENLLSEILCRCDDSVMIYDDMQWLAVTRQVEQTKALLIQTSIIDQTHGGLGN